MIRSPSQWPATRRSVASSGRSSMLIMPMIGALRPPRDRRGRRRVRLERIMIPSSRSVVRATAQNPDAGAPRQTRAAPIASGDPLQGPSVSSVASTRSPPGGVLPGRARARQVGQHPGPKGRAGVDHLGVLGRDLRRCAATSAPTGRYPQALLVAGDLPRDHRDITTDPLSDPPQRPALLQPPSDRSPIRHRQHPTQHNLPPLTSTVATTL